MTRLTVALVIVLLVASCTRKPEPGEPLVDADIKQLVGLTDVTITGTTFTPCDCITERIECLKETTDTAAKCTEMTATCVNNLAEMIALRDEAVETLRQAREMCR